MFYHCPWTREGSIFFVSLFIYMEQRMGAKKGNTHTRKHGLSASHIHPGNGSLLHPAPPQAIRSLFVFFRGKNAAFPIYNQQSAIINLPPLPFLFWPCPQTWQ
jgi:hypothetical protein